MREFVYLSERKLRQFTASSSRSPRWWQRLGFEGELAFPPFGRAKVASQESSGVPPTLTVDEVIAAFDAGDRHAGWFADGHVRAGQWVFFEAPLNHRVMEQRYFHSAALFLDSGVPAQNYPAGGSVRLLLHGAREHLLGVAAPSPVGLDVQAELDQAVPQKSSFASDTSYLYQLAGQKFGLQNGTVGYVLPQLSQDLLRNEEIVQDLSSTPLTVVRQHGNFAEALRMIVGLLDAAFVPETAAWMRGYARVTSAVDLDPISGPGEPRLVTATPLYVEYAPEPE
jgi:hypothetical protein